jgi:signal transduction histidine kinase
MSSMSVISDLDENIEIEREKLRRSGKLHLIHWLILGLSLVLTFSAWYFSKGQVHDKNSEKFHRQADQVVELVQERMKAYENALWAGVAFTAANNGKVSYEQWLTYSSTLDLETVYPGINGIGVIYNVQPNELDAFLVNERISRPDFKLHPEHDETEYWPITYVEPLMPNKNAVGLDMAFEHNRYTSVLKARDTGLAQLTGPITLVQDAKKTPGFLLYAPFYKGISTPQTKETRKEKIVGVTYAPFIMNKLMKGTLDRSKRHLSIRISDDDALLFDDQENENQTMSDSFPLFSIAKEIDIYGRHWKFEIKSDLQFRNEATNNQPYFILVGGLFIDVLLLGLFVTLTRANRFALSYADKMNHDLRTKTKHLGKLNHELEQFTYVASHDLKSPLNAIKQIAGWLEEDCGALLPDESRAHLDLLKKRSDRMMNLLNDLLAYARSNKEETVSEEVNLEKISLLLFNSLDAVDQFTLTSSNVDLFIPRIPLELILRNLISNAIKHHPKDSGKIDISYEATERMHIIRVSDDGEGIPEELREKAMEMFQTLKPRDQVEGSGMGLAMVKKVIQQHDGSISIESNASGGTTFEIYWPIDNSKD